MFERVGSEGGPGLQNLHPRFKSWRRLQFFSFFFSGLTSRPIHRTEPTWEHLGTKPVLDRRSPAGGWTVQRGCRCSVWWRPRRPQLLLGDLGRHAEVVEPRRVHVSKLVACPGHLQRIFRAGHPVWRRCSSVKYSRYAPSSRLASRVPRSGISITNDPDRPLVPGHPTNSRACPPLRCHHLARRASSRLATQTALKTRYARGFSSKAIGTSGAANGSLTWRAASSTHNLKLSSSSPRLSSIR